VDEWEREEEIFRERRAVGDLGQRAGSAMSGRGRGGQKPRQGRGEQRKCAGPDSPRHGQTGPGVGQDSTGERIDSPVGDEMAFVSGPRGGWEVGGGQTAAQ
jgi:hypothetical protein